MKQNKFIVIDVQGFFLDNKLYPKEVSISVDDDVKKIKSFLIEPPFKYTSLTQREKITNIWLYNHLHGLSWDDGDYTLKELKDYLKLILKKEKYLTIYVKGIEKLRCLKKLMGNEEQNEEEEEEEIYILNIDDMNCLNIKTLYKYNRHINICNSHNNSNISNCLCSEKNVIILRHFLNLYLNKENHI